jgi:rubredoxin
MKHTRTLTVSVEDAMYYGHLCDNPTDEEPKDRAIFDEEVTFPGGMRFAIQVVTTLDPTDGYAAWTQGVLFTENGCEITCTEVGESFLGEYTIPDGDDVYEVTVETDMHTYYDNGECPDCGEPISRFAVDGSQCSNCEHVFFTPKPDDGAVIQR